MTTRYRADQIGSLLRPPELLAARAAHAEGRLPAEGLREVEDRAILDALTQQRASGIDVLTDGEFRRGAFLTDVHEAVEGFVAERVELEWHGPGGGAEGSVAPVVGGRLRPRRPLVKHEADFLQAHAGGPYKVAVPMPSQLAAVGYKPGVTDQAYPTRAELLADFVALIRREVEGLVAAGVPYVQMDAPFYTYYADPAMRDRLRQAGLDPDQAFDDAVAADTACLTGVARGETLLAVHLCRGNSRSRWIAEGGYDQIAEKLFGTLPVDGFLLEYDSPRAGDFGPLRFVPPGKTVVLGLVTTKDPALESSDALRRRIDEAAQYVPLEDLALSPQCGFASTAAGNLLTPDQQWRKLALVAETARQVWG
jgi:5-methyltetrahydropteroyltriglutamate--homocysteine methyltransferase